MNFNLVSKNNMGYASALLLVVLLSQAKVFNFLIDTTLGRSILILFILISAYTNKILGVVVVLFIVIIFNNSDIGYLEGFTDSTNTTSTSTSTSASTSASGDSSAQTTLGSGELAQQIKDKKNSNSSTASAADPIPSSTTPTTTSTTNTTTPSTTDTTTTTATSSATAVEGFDIVGKERYIQKGNQSNQIPVNDFMRVSPDVAPYEGSPFGESFSVY